MLQASTNGPFLSVFPFLPLWYVRNVQYINGGSLEDLLHNRSISLSWSARVKIALDIASGMAYLHSRGVFHRDLSSRNCLIQMQTDGSMKCIVADFGLAAKIKQSRRRSHTEVVGSPYWMAPECLNGKEYCEQADVFSYGIVVAETATRLPADPDFMPRTRVRLYSNYSPPH
jgi:serine/threonine protein kinase